MRARGNKLGEVTMSEEVDEKKREEEGRLADNLAALNIPGT